MNPAVSVLRRDRTGRQTSALSVLLHLFALRIKPLAHTPHTQICSAYLSPALPSRRLLKLIMSIWNPGVEQTL